MPGKICIVTLILLVQYCRAQPACEDTNAKDVCIEPLYEKEVCTNEKCKCATSLTSTTDGKACELVKPVITGGPTDEKYYAEVTYSFECKTSIAPVPDFKWLKDGAVIPEATTKTFTIEGTETSPNGKYACQITVGKNEAKSDPIDVKVVIKPGRVCKDNNECTGEAYKQICDTTKPKRCVCAEGYVPKDDKCSNTATNLSASLLLFVSATFCLLVKKF